MGCNVRYKLVFQYLAEKAVNKIMGMFTDAAPKHLSVIMCRIKTEPAFHLDLMSKEMDEINQSGRLDILRRGCSLAICSYVNWSKYSMEHCSSVGRRTRW